MIEITHQHDITILTMAYGKANTLDPSSCDALVDAFGDCSAASVRAVVLTGRGGIFSAGVDLLRVVDGGPSYLQEFLPVLGRAFDAAFAFPKPLVAAVNGHAFAGGCILACTADRRLMSRGAGRIGVPELLVGIPFPTIAFEIVRFAVPAHHIASLVYTGDTVTADAAVERGLVDVSVEPDRLMDEAVTEARRLASLPPAAFAITKRQLRGPAFDRIRRGADVDAGIWKYWESPDGMEAIRTYVARTLKK
jgi:enoyl-CoA hydratase/carnithine racemase